MLELAIALTSSLLCFIALLVANIMVSAGLLSDGVPPRFGDHRPWAPRSRWYRLFFTAHEVMTPVFAGSPIGHVLFLGLGAGAVYLTHLAGYYGGGGAQTVYVVTFGLLFSGFFVTARRSR